MRGYTIYTLQLKCDIKEIEMNESIGGWLERKETKPELLAEWRGDNRKQDS